MEMVDQLLNDFLKELDKALTKKVSILVLGGNALILYGAKKETEDVDICIQDKEVEDFVIEYRRKSKIKIDAFIVGLFATLGMPDFLERAFPSPKKMKFKYIDVFLMNPYDIILTKLDRWKEKDQIDLRSLLTKMQIKREELEERYRFCLKHFRGSKKQKEKFMNNFNTFMNLLGNLLQ